MEEYYGNWKKLLFKKIIIVKDDIVKYQNEQGIVIMGIYDFLLDEDSLLKSWQYSFDKKLFL